SRGAERLVRRGWRPHLRGRPPGRGAAWRGDVRRGGAGDGTAYRMPGAGRRPADAGAGAGRRGGRGRSGGLNGNGDSRRRTAGMDRDQRFKLLLQEFLAEFFALFFPEWADRFDFTKVEWLDKEVFVDPPQGSHQFLDLGAGARIPRINAIGTFRGSAN